MCVKAILDLGFWVFENEWSWSLKFHGCEVNFAEIHITHEVSFDLI